MQVCSGQVRIDLKLGKPCREEVERRISYMTIGLGDAGVEVEEGQGAPGCMLTVKVIIPALFLLKLDQ